MKRTICILCSLCFCCVCAIGEEEPEESEILMQPAVSIVEDAVTIEGDVILSSDENDVIGISIEKNNGKTNEVTITGAVYAERKPGTEVTDTKAYGMVVSASGEGTEVAVTVQDSVSAAATVTEGNTDAGAVDISTSEGASAEVRVWGSVSAAAMQERDSYTWAAGVSVYNSDSRADVIVDGNVQADSAVYGVGINCRQSGDNETYSVIRVNGDVTAETLGNEVSRIYDVGVSGIHRLFARLDDIRKADVVIVVAGMEGALASVLGGLVAAPVIAVPTSVGYGANFGGLSALLSMLNSCANGVSIVNIDNGFGAGYTASVINKR